MSKLTITRHDFIQDRQARMFADVLDDSEQPFDAVLDFFPSKHPHDTKRSRQAVGIVTRLGMEHHGWKQTGTKSSLWAFEHRWAHRRDRAEGRNHRPQSN
jgi:hypothetical protein